MCKTGSAVIAAVFALALVANAAGATPYPCRILDTRTYDGYTLGPLPAGQTWSFSLKMPVASQRAEPGCSVPASATAALLTITVIGPPATGYVKTWAWGQPQPLSVAFGYPAVPSGALVSGSVLVPLCVQVGLDNCEEDFHLLTSQTTHVVIEIQAAY